MSETEIMDGEYLPAESAQRAMAGGWGESPLAALSPEEFERRLKMAALGVQRIQRLQLEVMKDGVDYGVVPGTSKPTLLKSGAELLNKLAHLVPTFEVARMVGDGVSAPGILYRVTCFLRSGDAVVAQGEGSCNSWERKYRYRKGGIECPECGRATVMRSKFAKSDDDYWYCNRKADGCGATFARDDDRMSSVQAEAENPDPLDQDNTLLKMAKKRALLDATLGAHACSGIFTQDLEDMDPASLGTEKSTRPATAPRRGPVQKSGAAAPSGTASEAQQRLIWARMNARMKDLMGQVSKDEVNDALHAMLTEGGIESVGAIPRKDVDAIVAAIEKWSPGDEPAQPGLPGA